MLQITTKPSSSTNNEIAHVNTYYNPSHYLQFEQLLLCNLSHTYYDVRCGNGVRVVVENKIGWWNRIREEERNKKRVELY